MNLLSSAAYALTGFGDLAVLLPLSTVMLVWLAWARSTREAMRWAIAVAFCGGAIAVLKIYFYACPPLADLRSPSGHTGLSTLVYGAVALLAAADARGWRRWAVAVVAGALILTIAATRYLLGAHSLAEIAMGFVVGIASLAIFRGRCLVPTAGQASPRPLLITAVLLAVILDGQQLHAEEMLHVISNYFWAGAAACG